jgi:putative transposase
VGEVWPATIVQACTVHLIRNSFRYLPRQHWDALRRDLKPIYTAPTATAAEAALDHLNDRWGGQYPALIRMWRSCWNEFIPFLDYGGCRRIACRRPRVAGVAGNMWRGQVVSSGASRSADAIADRLA